MRMKSFLWNLNVIALMATVLFMSSCDDKSSDPVIEEPDAIVPGNINATMFTATVTGSFSGISKVDLALGKSGILFCEKTDKAESIFKSWKDGNNNPDCNIFANGRMSSDSYSGTIQGLIPDTEYCFCLYSIDKDNNNRQISAIGTFKTLPFKPDIAAAKMDSVHYIDAIAKVRVTMDEKDAPYCSMGILLSETADGKAEGSTLFPYSGGFDGTVRVELTDIKSNQEYYCRLYMRYPIKDDVSDYIYGPETVFTTKDLMNTAIDLGLPSGIRWADFSLGDYEFASHLDHSPLYYWGSSREMVEYIDEKGHYNFTKVDYEHVDAAGNYIYLGREISGTEYDAAHKKYGGKWRMPTKADIEELMENCSLSGKKSLYHKHYVYVYNYQDNAYRKVEIDDTVNYFEVKGTNGNSIRFRYYESIWSGTMNDDDYVYYLYNRPDDQSRPSIQLQTTTRQLRVSIRPVWDPNMPDE